MKKLYERAYAKLNLDLHVINKRDDGFHELKSIVLPLMLFDELTFETADKNKVESNVLIEENIVLKTIEYIQQKYDIKLGVKVKLNKQIPIGSGLGGGSANSAATIRALNLLFDLNLSEEEMKKIASDLGSDILFCLYNKPAVISGRGDKIEFIENPQFDTITLIVLPTKNLTKDVFSNHKVSPPKTTFNAQIENYMSEDINNYTNNIENQLLESALKTNDEFSMYYNQIKQISPSIMMTGSGSTLYLINTSNEVVKKLKEIEKIEVFDTKIKKNIYKTTF